MAKTLNISTSYGTIEVTLVKRGKRLAGVVTLPDEGGYALGDPEIYPQIDVITAMILGHACSGVNVATKSYAVGVQAALDAIGNQD